MEEKKNYVQFLRQYVGHAPILTAGVGLIVLNQNKEILMQLRGDTHTWGCPGGSMELGESFEDTARRELMEETGLTIGKMQFLDILSGKETYRVYPNGDALYDVTALYLITDFSGEMKIDEEETKALKWVSLQNPPEKVSEMTLKFWNKIIEYVNNHS